MNFPISAETAAGSQTEPATLAPAATPADGGGCRARPLSPRLRCDGAGPEGKWKAAPGFYPDTLRHFRRAAGSCCRHREAVPCPPQPPQPRHGRAGVRFPRTPRHSRAGVRLSHPHPGGAGVRFPRPPAHSGAVPASATPAPAVPVSASPAPSQPR